MPVAHDGRPASAGRPSGYRGARERQRPRSAPPEVPAALAVDIARSVFDVDGEATPLDGERDRNFRIEGADGSFVLKVGNPADPADVVEMQVLAMEHALRVDPTLRIPHPRRTIDGRPTGTVAIDGVDHAVQLVSLIDGTACPPGPPTPTARRSIGAAVAQIDLALAGFIHPLAHRAIAWDVTRLPELRPKLDHVPSSTGSLVERWLDRFDAVIAPALELVPALHDPRRRQPGEPPDRSGDPDRVAGIVDFGDLVHARTVLDPAIAAAYQAFGSDDPLDPLVEVVTAYHALRPLTRAEIELIPELAAARMTQSLLSPPGAPSFTRTTSTTSWPTGRLLRDARAARRSRCRALAAPSPTRAGCIGAPNLVRREPVPPASTARPALSLSYDDPVRLESGDGVWLTDVDGNRLLDAYNNVPQVGHAHPRVTAALSSQARRLTTNTRYLVDEVAIYADRLTALLPDELSVVMFVNSGSEANDVAIQIARAVTGNRGVVITEHAYHGTTAATAALSPEELGPAALEPWVARIGAQRRSASADAAARVVGEVDDAFARLRGRARSGVPVCDDVFASDGIFAVPPGYLRAAYERARAVGALCLADEVQAGFGRVGEAFWGFAQDGVGRTSSRSESRWATATRWERWSRRPRSQPSLPHAGTSSRRSRAHLSQRRSERRFST